MHFSEKDYLHNFIGSILFEKLNFYLIHRSQNRIKRYCCFEATLGTNGLIKALLIVSHNREGCLKHVCIHIIGAIVVS